MILVRFRCVDVSLDHQLIAIIGQKNNTIHYTVDISKTVDTKIFCSVYQ